MILDSPRGGAGLAFDWELAQNIRPDRGDQKVILAGDVNPENIRVAIARVAPFGIDVMTGVRVLWDELDHEKITEMVETVHTENS